MPQNGVDAIVDCSFSAHATEDSVTISSALCIGAASQVTAKPFAKGAGGCEGPRAPAAPRGREAGKRPRLGHRVLEVGCSPGGPAAENTSFHWHRTRDTEEAQLKRKDGGRWRAGWTGSQQRKPSLCQQFTWRGFLGLWHFVSQCNFTRVCVCVFHLSINKKQQQEGSL